MIDNTNNENENQNENFTDLHNEEPQKDFEAQDTTMNQQINIDPQPEENKSGSQNHNQDNQTATKSQIAFTTQDNYQKKNSYGRRTGGFMRLVSAVAITAVITAGAVGGGLSYKYQKQTDARVAELEKKIDTMGKIGGGTPSNQIQTQYTPGTTTTTQIIKSASPSVVGIRTTVMTEFNPFMSNNSGSGEGSGIVISEDGYIATNYHVVASADPKGSTSKNTTLDVFLADGKQLKAEFVGGDSKNDLAVIKVNTTGLKPAKFGDSDKLQVGDVAIAIGNPLGIEFYGSVTQGIISAVNRVLDDGVTSQTLIQTDAAINPGNSGGALINSAGEVIGINSAKIADTKVEGIGFAIPINKAKPIFNDLITYGYVKGRPLVGITGQQVTEAISSKYNLPIGIYVTKVADGTGAAAAGIKEGDVITKFDGKQITSMQDINKIKEKYKAGDTVKGQLIREGKTIDFTLKFSEDK